MRYYILVFLLYELFFGFYFVHDYKDTVAEYKKQVVNVMNTSFSNAVNSYRMIYDDFYLRQSDDLSKLVSASNGASSKKRDEIRLKILRKYNNFFEFEKLNNLNGMHIFDANGLSLLRFHKPFKYDDNISKTRYSVRQLKKQTRYDDGFEVGVFQESYRFQYPLFYDGKYVGAYEYNLNPEALLDKMQNFYAKEYHQIYIAPFMDRIIKKSILKQNYVLMQIGDTGYYSLRDSLYGAFTQKKLNLLAHMSEFQEALKLCRPSFIEYMENFKYEAIVTIPVYNLKGDCFSYILAYIKNPQLHYYFKVLIIEILFMTFLGLVVAFYFYEDMKNKIYAQELMNLQHDLIVVSDGQNIDDANKAFLKFVGFKDLKSFTKVHNCICDYFVEGDGYLSAFMNNVGWIDYLKANPEGAKVQMFNRAKELRVFTLELEAIPASHRFFMLFRDVTEDMHEKAALEERANFDQLTQIYNRGMFEFFLKQELEKAQRYEHTFSIIMFDIDHFKAINDTYGHDVGDVVLQELATLVSEHVRDVDIFARWGGEEFMIISNTNIYQSEMFAEKLRKVINEHVFNTIHTLSCSFGIAEYREDDTKESIVKRVDNMLYSAKNSGRNCVVSLK